MPKNRLDCCSKKCYVRYDAWKLLSEEEFDKKISNLDKTINCLNCDILFKMGRPTQLHFCSKYCWNLIREEKIKAGECAHCDKHNILLLEFTPN